VAHHRFINFSVGIDKDSSGGMKGGERDQKPTKDERARVLAKFKARLENMRVDGYVITELADDLPQA